MKHGWSAAALSLVLTFASNANGDPDACREAIGRYKSAQGDIVDALKTYANCIAESRGQDDCSAEFSQLKIAQDDLESAVWDYRADCR